MTCWLLQRSPILDTMLALISFRSNSVISYLPSIFLSSSFVRKTLMLTPTSAGIGSPDFSQFPLNQIVSLWLLSNNIRWDWTHAFHELASFLIVYSLSMTYECYLPFDLQVQILDTHSWYLYNTDSFVSKPLPIVTSASVFISSKSGLSPNLPPTTICTTIPFSS